MGHFVYALAVKHPDGKYGPVKVGITGGNVRKRLSQIRTASPYHVELLHSFTLPNKVWARSIEKSFHRDARGRRLRGEWFNMPPHLALRGLIYTMIRAGRRPREYVFDASEVIAARSVASRFRFRGAA